MIDLRHLLAVLANRMPWQEIKALLAHFFARQVRACKKIEGLDLFGATEVITSAGVSKALPPRLPTRLMVTLLYLKHTSNQIDEDLIQGWGLLGKVTT
jgi:IS5 family transposase